MRPMPRFRRHLRVAGLAVGVVLTLGAGASAADEPGAESIFAVARAAQPAGAARRPQPAEDEEDAPAGPAGRAGQRPAPGPPNGPSAAGWLYFLLVLGVVAIPVVVALVLFFVLMKAPTPGGGPGRWNPAADAALVAAAGEHFRPRRAEAPRDAPPADPAPETGIQADVPRAAQTGIRADAPKLLPAPSREVVVPGQLAGGAVRCASCSHLVPAWPHLPPWCPHCGADLKGCPAIPAPAATPLPTASSPAPVPAVQPPFFHAQAVLGPRGGCYFRVYVLPDQLLFLDAGPEGPSPYAALLVVNAGLIGGLIARSINEGRKEKAKARRWQLDVADTDELVRMADEGRHNFRAAPADLEELRLEPWSFWRILLCSKFGYAGLLRFRHRALGKFALEFQDVDEMRKAAEVLPRVFGDRLAVHVAWDYGKQRYVRKL